MHTCATTAQSPETVAKADTGTGESNGEGAGEEKSHENNAEMQSVLVCELYAVL